MRKVIVFIGLIVLRIADAQQPSPSIQIANTTSQSKAIPQHLIYRHFLKWVLDLDNNATAAGSDDPYKFAEPFAERVGLEHSYLDIIRSEAKALDKDLTVQDAKAAAVVAKFRAAGKDALQRGLPIPAAPTTTIKELQQEREALIKSHISVLRAALGTTAAAKLDAYLSLEFAPHVSLKAIVIPRPNSTAR